MSDQEMISTIDVEELVEGSSIFQSNGISILKVTQNGEVKKLRVPIKSSGVDEVIRNFERKKPRPPIINVVVKPGDSAFKDLNLNRKQHIKTFDFTDEAYLDEVEKYSSQLGLQIVLQGINVVLKDKEKNIIEDDDRKISVLRNMGLSSEHFTQLVRDIRNLTRWEDQNTDDFLE